MKYTLPVLLLLALDILLLRVGAYSVPHVDSCMHFAGGITLGIFIYGLLSRAIELGWVLPLGRFLMFVVIFALVTTGAVFWEFFEWSLDQTIGTRMQRSIDDTMKDLLLGQIGATVYASVVINSFNRRPSLSQNPPGKQTALLGQTN